MIEAYVEHISRSRSSRQRHSLPHRNEGTGPALGSNWGDSYPLIATLWWFKRTRLVPYMSSSSARRHAEHIYPEVFTVGISKFRRRSDSMWPRSDFVVMVNVKYFYQYLQPTHITFLLPSQVALNHQEQPTSSTEDPHTSSMRLSFPSASQGPKPGLNVIHLR